MMGWEWWWWWRGGGWWRPLPLLLVRGQVRFGHRSFVVCGKNKGLDGEGGRGRFLGGREARCKIRGFLHFPSPLLLN